MYDQAVIEAIR
jgi:hypothetical protein